jgi:hypothetical protein
VPLGTNRDLKGASQTRRRPWSIKCAVKLVYVRVPSVCIGLRGACLVVAMLSLNMGGTYGSLIFKTGSYGSFTYIYIYIVAG